MVSEPRDRSYAPVISAVGGNDTEALPPEQARTPMIEPPRRTTNAEDPLLLPANESASKVLVSPPLTASNYNSWSRSMTMALKVRNKWGIISGAIPVPASSDPEYEAWERCNILVSTWIINSLSPSIAQSVMYFDLAENIWEDLKNRFSQVDAHRISDLQDEIYSLRQGACSVTDYYTQSRILWEEMSSLRPLPVCECNLKCQCGLNAPKCSCELAAKIRKEREDDQVIRFLKGLSDEFSSIKSGVLLLDPMPPVHKVFAMAMKLERQLHGLETTHINASLTDAVSENIVAAINNNKRKFTFNNVNKSVAKCTFCGMTGHTVEKCYKKHGYPPGWIPGYKSKGKQIQTGVSAAVSGNANQKYVSSGQVEADLNLSNEQIQKLISMLQLQVGQNSSSSPTAASVSVMSSGLVPNFKAAAAEQLPKGTTWQEDEWFC